MKRLGGLRAGMTAASAERRSTRVVVALLATLLWVGTSLAVAGVVEPTAGITAISIGVPFLALLFAYHVLFHEHDREWARVVASLLAVTGAVGLVAIFLQNTTVTFVANVLALVGMFALVAFLWR